ncbi:MAG: cytochrome c biogenesis CcdA family protein [Acholeplasmataceae bacterium]
MKSSRIKSLFFAVLILLSVLPNGLPLRAESDASYDAIYFVSRYCEDCQGLERDGVIEDLIEAGYSIKKYVLEDEAHYAEVLRDYQFTYGVPMDDGMVPIIFVGPSYFTGRSSIREAVEDRTIQNIMDSEDLLEVNEAPASDFSLLYFVLLGLVDGVNPCAIAMLLMFISLLGFTRNKRVLTFVSLTFISAIFISYFLFGTVLYSYLSRFSAGSFIVEVVPWVILSIAFVLFVLNFYDFLVTRKERYDKVKNQLPNAIQRFNRRLIKAFTDKMDEGSPLVYVITFIIGLLISFTEFLCTGQAYLTAILHLIHFTEFLGRGIILLFVYNLIFVLPLIVLSFIAIKTQSIIEVSGFMREKLHVIKLFNAIVFLAIFVYYIFYVT